MAVPYHVTCTCGQLLVVPEDRAGAAVRCPRCERSLTVPPAQLALESDTRPDDIPAESATPFPIIQPISRQRGQREVQRRRETNAAYWLAVALVLVALVSVTPLLVVVLRGNQARELLKLEPWAYAIIFSALLQCAYLIYLVQLPDWSTLRVIAVLTLLHATLYAVLAGVQLLASGNNTVTQWMGLAATRFTAGQQAGWCLIMVLLYGTICYLASHIAGRWQKRAAAGNTPVASSADNAG